MSVEAARRWLGRNWPLLIIASFVGYQLWAQAAVKRKVRERLEGREAPALSLPQVAGGPRERVSLDALRGRVVVLDFWASWCGPCEAAAKELSAARRTLSAREDVVFLAVNVEPRLRPEAVAAAHAQFGYAFPTLHDEAGEAQATFGITNLPTVVLLDPRGVVRHVEIGATDAEDLVARINSLIQ